VLLSISIFSGDEGMISKYRSNFKKITVFFLVLLLIPYLVYAAPLETVTNTNDAGAGSLRQAIADVDPGGEIIFNIPGAGPHTIFTSSPLEIDKALTIKGPGENLLTINSVGAGLQGIIVSDMLVTQQHVVISGLTLDGGMSNISGILNRENLTLNKGLKYLSVNV
jgi:hypothetical protein